MALQHQLPASASTITPLISSASDQSSRRALLTIFRLHAVVSVEYDPEHEDVDRFTLQARSTPGNDRYWRLHCCICASYVPMLADLALNSGLSNRYNRV